MAPKRQAMAPATSVDRDKITDVVRTMIESLQGDFTVADLALYRELENLAVFIQTAKREIAALQPQEIREKHLPSATDELDAIVGATEEATGVILDSVEQIEASAGRIGGEEGTKIGDLVTRIYEACNFQDITGQRITKVVKTMKHIEVTIDALVKAFGVEHRQAQGTSTIRAAAPVATPPTAKVKVDEDLLNGPQLPGAGNSQADIDALFK